MGYRGWHGITDHLHILIAVSYEPIEGTLACRMCSGEPVIHLNVPEAIYQSLLRNKFAGSYYRKRIKPKYPILGAVTAPAALKEKMEPRGYQVPQTRPLTKNSVGEDQIGSLVRRRSKGSPTTWNGWTKEENDGD